MKDTEFIELLNLYLDHELSPEDSARLEAEVQSDPEHHRIYLEYCRMQKACTHLVRRFESEAVRSEFAPPVLARTDDRSRFGAGNFRIILGALAAAACVAIILTVRKDPTGSRPTAGYSEVIVREQSPAAAPKFGSSPRTVPSQSVGEAVRPAASRRSLVTNRLLLTGQSPANLLLQVANGPLEPELDWLRNTRLAPVWTTVPLQELRFDARPVSLRPESGSLNAGPTTDFEIEMTALRFVK